MPDDWKPGTIDGLTIGQLIEKLQQFDPRLPVKITGAVGILEPVTDVYDWIERGQVIFVQIVG